jgi:hypothetical protein
MKLVCENCKQTDKGRYSTFYFEKRLITLCDECRWGTTKTVVGEDKDKKLWEHLSTPFWVHMGLDPKTAVEKKQVAHLKKHNMSWGDLRKERDSYYARSKGGWNQYLEYKRKGGRVPDASFKKES